MGCSCGSHVANVAEVIPAGQRPVDQAKSDGAETIANPEESESESEASPPGPLQEGDYIWKLEEPAKVFCSKFGNPGDGYADVSQLTITHFLGAGAGGTVYKASFEGPLGSAECAVKFSEVLPDEEPKTHAAVDLLVNRDKKKSDKLYMQEKLALQMLRPTTADQLQEFVGGSFRMMQWVGFYDPGAVLLLESCTGSSPAPPDGGEQLIPAVKAFLKSTVQARTKVEVGDIKLGNLIQDSNNPDVTTIIDFGTCQYVGGATCKLCGEVLPDMVDEHLAFHVADYMQAKKVRVPPSRLQLQEFCYGQQFC